jgi:hypothetical protein
MVQIESVTNQTAPAERPRLRPRALLGLLGGVGCVLFAGVIALRATEHVVRQGDIFGFGAVAEVELFGRFTVYRDSETLTHMDLLNGFLLIAIASTSFFVALLLSAGSRIERRFLFFVVATFGAAYLAADEVLGLHETLGANLRFLAELPGIRHPDDAVFAAYALPVAVFVYCFRAILASSRRTLAVLAGGAGLYVLGVVMDVRSLPYEEYVEPLASWALLVGFVSLGYQQSRLGGKDAHS